MRRYDAFTGLPLRQLFWTVQRPDTGYPFLLRILMTEPMPQAKFHVRPAKTPDAPVEISFQGDWRLETDIPPFETLIAQITAQKPIIAIGFDTSALGSWDSIYLAFLLKLRHYCQSAHIPVNVEGLPEGARRILKLSLAVPERQGARRDQRRGNWLVRMGDRAVAVADGGRSLLAFIGEIVMAGGRFGCWFRIAAPGRLASFR